MVGLPVLQIPGIPGGPEVLIILVIIVLLFGANKIPQLAGALGQARGEFDKGRQEVEEELEQMQDSDMSGTELSGEPSDSDSQTGTVESRPADVNEKNPEVESEQ